MPLIPAVCRAVGAWGKMIPFRTELRWRRGWGGTGELLAPSQMLFAMWKEVGWRFGGKATLLPSCPKEWGAHWCPQHQGEPAVPKPTLLSTTEGGTVA